PDRQPRVAGPDPPGHAQERHEHPPGERPAPGARGRDLAGRGPARPPAGAARRMSGLDPWAAVFFFADREQRPALASFAALAAADRERLHLGYAHLYAPAAVMAAGSVIHLAARWGTRFQEGELEIRRAALVYGLCYVLLLLVGLGSRMRRIEAKPRGAVGTVTVERGVELEEQGRYGVAARVYEREGQVEKAAQAAERAGEWERAARLFRRGGRDFEAA